MNLALSMLAAQPSSGRRDTWPPSPASDTLPPPSAPDTLRALPEELPGALGVPFVDGDDEGDWLRDGR